MVSRGATPLVPPTSFCWRPERLLGRHKLDRHIFYKRSQPSRALFHPCLFGGHMPDYNQRFSLSFAGCVRRIFHRFPFASFAHQQNFHVIHFQCLRFPFESRRSRAQPQLRHFHLWISYCAQHRGIQPLCHIRCQLLQRDFWHREQVRVFRVLVSLPAQRLHHAGQDPVRLSKVPVVVESPDDQPVFLDKVPLLLPHCVVLFHSLRPVQVIVKRGLVRDDQILPVGRRPLQYVHCRHHRDGYPCHARVRISRLKRVYGFRFPRHANVFLDRRYHFLCRRPFFLGGRERAAQHSPNQYHAKCVASQFHFGNPSANCG